MDQLTRMAARSAHAHGASLAPGSSADKKYSKQPFDDDNSANSDDEGPKIDAEVLQDFERGIQQVKNASNRKQAALDIVRNQIETGQRTLRIESLGLQKNLNFLRNIEWESLEQVHLAKNHLLNIDAIDKFQNLRIVDASNNYIEEVSLSLPKLESLNLMNNYLISFPKLKNMKSLKYLDLTSNKITDFKNVAPSLTPNIERLELARNDLWFEVKQEFTHFLRILMQFTKLKVLHIQNNPFLSEQGLALIRPQNIKLKFLDSLGKLERFNGEDVARIRQKEQRYEDGSDNSSDDENDNNEQANGKNEQSTSQAYSKVQDDEEKRKDIVIKKKEKEDFPPRLINLLYQLEQANNKPSKAMDNLIELSDLVDEVVAKVDLLEVSGFAPDNVNDPEDLENKENIESFMQNCLLVIDNLEEYQSIMLQILAKLSIIKYKNFGLSCFNTLKDLMMSGSEMKSKVTEVLLLEVINKMRQQDPTEIPESLLKGLCQLVDDVDNPGMLSGMYEMCFPVWLRSYCDKHLSSTSGQNVKDHGHFDAIIQLVSLSVRSTENVELFLEKQLITYIIKIANYSDRQHKRYIPALDLIASLSNQSKEAADMFMKDLHGAKGDKKAARDDDKNQQIYKILTKRIMESLLQIKNKEGQKESHHQLAKKLQKYKTLAAEITTLGGLLNSQYRDKILKIKARKGKEVDVEKAKDSDVVLNIMSQMRNKNADPIMLTAVCKFAMDVMECKEVLDDEETFRPYYEMMSELKCVLPYLGKEQYYPLLQKTRKYIQIKSKRANDAVQDEVHPLQDPNMNSQTKKELILKSLSTLEDPYVSRLFVSIINLMHFICQTAVSSNQNSLFEQFAEALDESGREEVLFNCLAMPNDNVRLAVVKCLFVVPLDQFDESEMELIVKTISECTNISAGETELVLATVYWICYKFVDFDSQNKESSKIFQSKFGKQTVEEALNFLNKNLQREQELEEEDMQKYALSLSILNFLKASSQQDQMRKYLKNKSKIFKEIMINEEQHSSSIIGHIPIDIENSYLGRDVKSLLEVVSGQESVHPYGDVSFRIIAKIADVLTDSNKCDVFQIQNSKDDPMDDMYRFYKEIYRQRKSGEKQYWIDVPPRFIESMEPEALQNHIDQHYIFTQSNGVALIKMFLTSKVEKNEEMLRFVSDPQLDDQQMFNPEGSRWGLDSEVYEQTQLFEKKFKDKYVDNSDFHKIRKAFHRKHVVRTRRHDDALLSKMPSARDNKAIPEVSNHCKPTRQYKFKQNMQFEEVGADYTGVAQDDYSYEVQERQLQENCEDEMRRKLDDPGSGGQTLAEMRGDGFQNRQQRSLTIAAYLRCLYGAIEFAPSVDLRNHSVQHIRDPLTFRKITQLCDATDWDESACIGAKYLRVMRNIIRIPFHKEREEPAILIHYELLAVVIKKVLEKVIKKMNNEVQLTDGDTITIYEASMTLSTILQQVNHFAFSDLDLMRLHNLNELKIYQLERKLKAHQDVQDKLVDDAQRKHAIQHLKSKISQYMAQKEVAGRYSDADFAKNGRPSFKCMFQEQVQEEPVTPENFHVDKVLIREKRSVQSKVVEFLVLRLFQKSTIEQLLDILFKDMAIDAQIYDQTREKNFKADHVEGFKVVGAGMKQQEDQLSEHSYLPERFVHEDDGACGRDHNHAFFDVGEDEHGHVAPLAQKFNVNVEEYVKIKGTLYIEKIKDIVGGIMANCSKNMKYEILQYIMKQVVFKKQKLRESFMQEILKACDDAEFEIALQFYLNQNDMTVSKYFSKLANLKMSVRQDGASTARAQPNSQKMERIIALSWVDLNNTVVEAKSVGAAVAAESLEDKNFNRRLFVVTNQGIQVLCDIPDAIKCLKCPPNKFCPRGPLQEFCIRFSDVERVINFPQTPQKISIIYDSEHLDENGVQDGQFTYQLTLNVPTFTKASSLYRILMEIVNVERQADAMQMYHAAEETPLGGQLPLVKKASKKSKQATNNQMTPEPFQTPNGAQPTITLNKHYRHTDILLQFELRQFLKQEMFHLRKLEKSDVNKLQLTYVTVTASTLLGTQSFNRFARNTRHSQRLIDYSKTLQGHDFIQFIQEHQEHRGLHGKSTIDNCVALFIVRNKLFLVKEQWHQWVWKRSEDVSEFKAYQRTVERARDKKKGGGLVDLQSDEEDDDDHRKQEVRKLNERNLVRLFDLILCLDCEEINQVKVHKGKDPSIDIKCYDNAHKISLLFTGDMERQRFIEIVFDVMRKMENPVLDSSDEEAEPSITSKSLKSARQRQRAAVTPDDDHQDDESDEIIMEQPIYD